GELWQGIGAWGLSYALSPEDRRSFYLTVYNLGDPFAAMVGPIVLMVGVIRGGSVGWLILAGAFALTGMAVRAIGRRADRPARPAHEREAHHCAPVEGEA